MPLKILNGNRDTKLTIDLTDWLTNAGLDIADRTALIFMLKSDVTVADDVAEYSVEEGSDLSVSGNVISATISDYTNIVVGTRYFIGLGIMFDTDTVYRELKFVQGKDSVVFEQDVIRA